MIGILVVTHGDVARALVECAVHILGPLEAVRALEIDADDNHDVALGRIRGSIKELGTADGVLVLTDMFGGTPSNVSLTLLDPGKIEVISGVNMPMLLHAITARERGLILAELARGASASACKNIIVAGALLDDGAAATE